MNINVRYNIPSKPELKDMCDKAIEKRKSKGYKLYMGIYYMCLLLVLASLAVSVYVFRDQQVNSAAIWHLVTSVGSEIVILIVVVVMIISYILNYDMLNDINELKKISKQLESGSDSDLHRVLRLIAFSNPIISLIEASVRGTVISLYVSTDVVVVKYYVGSDIYEKIVPVDDIKYNAEETSIKIWQNTVTLNVGYGSPFKKGNYDIDNIVCED